MGPITYSLCQSFVGAALWLTGACVFPPPIPPAAVSLSAPGRILDSAFVSPVETTYSLSLKFEFPTTEDRLNDSLVGNRFSNHCWGETMYDTIPVNERQGLGRPVPLRIVLRAAATNTVVLDKTFHSLCSSGHVDNYKTRLVGRISLDRTRYTLEVHNVLAQPDFERAKITLALIPGQGK